MGSNPIAVTKSFSIINCFHKAKLDWLWSYILVCSIKINLIEVLSLQSMVFDFTLISLSFQGLQKWKQLSDFEHWFIAVIAAFEYILVSYIFVDIFWNNLCFIAIFVIIFFVVTTHQVLSWSFSTLLKIAFQEFLFSFYLSCH